MYDFDNSSDHERHHSHGQGHAGHGDPRDRRAGFTPNDRRGGFAGQRDLRDGRDPRDPRDFRGQRGPRMGFGPADALDPHDVPRDDLPPIDALPPMDPRGHHGPRGRGGFGPGFGPGEDPRGMMRGMGRGGPRGEGRGGKGSRAGRGDIRGAILLLLKENPMHGYQLIQEISERTGGRWSPSAGTIYPALSLLEDEGLITITPDSGRKLASLTEDGVAYIEANSEPLNASWGRATGAVAQNARTLRSAIEGVLGAARQVSHSGTEAQNTAALAVLEQAKRSLYLILAGEPETVQETTPDDAAASDSATSAE